MSGYCSTWEQLLHTTGVSQPDSNGTSTVERRTTMRRATHPLPSLPLQHPNQLNQQPFTSHELETHGLAPRVSNSTQGEIRQETRVRSVTPVTHRGPGTRYSAFQPFSFQLPGRTSYPVHRVLQSDHGSMSIGRRSDGDDRFTPHSSTRVPAQLGRTSPRPST